MGRFEKLNDDIQSLADKVLENQDLCKLIYYSETSPIDMPVVNGKRDVMNKRLLLFTPKFPLIEEVGTFVTIRPTPMNVVGSEQFIRTNLVVSVFCHKKARRIRYRDSNGITKYGDRAILIVDMIAKEFEKVNTSIGKNSLKNIYEITNSDSTFSGYNMMYEDIDFRKRGS